MLSFSHELNWLSSTEDPFPRLPSGCVYHSCQPGKLVHVMFWLDQYSAYLAFHVYKDPEYFPAVMFTYTLLCQTLESALPFYILLHQAGILLYIFWFAFTYLLYIFIYISLCFYVYLYMCSFSSISFTLLFFFSISLLAHRAIYSVFFVLYYIALCQLQYTALFVLYCAELYCTVPITVYCTLCTILWCTVLV